MNHAVPKSVITLALHNAAFANKWRGEPCGSVIVLDFESLESMLHFSDEMDDYLAQYPERFPSWTGVGWYSEIQYTINVVTKNDHTYQTTVHCFIKPDPEPDDPCVAGYDDYAWDDFTPADYPDYDYPEWRQDYATRYPGEFDENGEFLW